MVRFSGMSRKERIVHIVEGDLWCIRCQKWVHPMSAEVHYLNEEDQCMEDLV